MARLVIGIVLCFFVATLAWVILGTSVWQRTYSADSRLHDEVADLWGEPQVQLSPEVTFRWRATKTEKEEIQDPVTRERKVVTREKKYWKDKPVILDRSAIEVDLSMDHRRKGLIWYATYGVDFRGEYGYVHDEDREGVLVITYRFPTSRASYENFRFEVNGRQDPKQTPEGDEGTRIVEERVPVRQGNVVPFRIAYRSRGLDWWRYSFGPDVSRVKDFRMSMTTDFDAIDFPQGTISPGFKERAGSGWRLGWEFDNLISGFELGMEMPRRLNPGPLAARISYFAPVCLGFFFAWIFVITLLRNVRLHPMNYLFLAAAFFSFHLLFAYTVDHLPLIPAFLAASTVSVFLVVSYLRLVVGLRFAALEAGVSQMIYLVFFSYAHFLEGFTGLVVTIGSILTLFALMQLTGRFDWSERFSRLGASPTAEGAAAGP